jgi:hypothetical protein
MAVGFRLPLVARPPPAPEQISNCAIGARGAFHIHHSVFMPDAGIHFLASFPF